MLERFNLPVWINPISDVRPHFRLFYPKIVGLPNQTIQAQMNQMITLQVQQLMNMQTDVQIPGPTEINGFYELKTNQRGVLSLTQGNSAYTPPMAHGMTFLKSLTFDIHTGQPYELAELFKSDSNYIDLISDLIRVQIKEREIPVLQEFTMIKADQDFYIADKALVIYFQLYEITPYYVGLPMFPISVYQLQDIIAEDSPLGKMLPSI